MTHWIAVSRSEHADSHWRPKQGFGFAANLQVVAILMAELSKLLPHYVLGFIRNGEQYQPVALVGLGGERNLYVNKENKWLCTYVPATLRGFPFTLADNDSGEQILCINESQLTEDPTAPPLFDSDGNLTARTASIFDFLGQCHANRVATQAACAVLESCELIEPWPFTINRGEDLEPLAIKGLYRINEQALNELDGSQFAALRKSGATTLAYAQLFSRGQIDQLALRAEYVGKEIESTSSRDLDDFFQDGGSLNLDFLNDDNTDIH